jgi:hypothetical protein
MPLGYPPGNVQTAASPIQARPHSVPAIAEHQTLESRRGEMKEIY